jgi:hypothetical protein
MIRDHGEHAANPAPGSKTRVEPDRQVGTAGAKGSGLTASGYTPKPSFESGVKRRTQRIRLILFAAVSAVLIGGGALMLNHHSGSPGASTTNLQASSRVESQNVVFVSDRDLDVQATEAARAALKRGEVPPSLANLPPQVRQELLSGERSFYHTRPAIERRDDDTAAVRISVDAIQFQDVILSHVPAYFSLPLKRNVPAEVTYLVTADRGGKGVAFEVVSSTRQLTTRTLMVGEKISETVLLQ